ncbi:DUF6099 family protein [Kitasatospora sp. MAP5-34]|uniref:DUF6099 family protein n=1 Tax=Kitasatospora sp. MAP5-34 TaxID=3035102 RepID=UPI00247BC938|nr:hypothetical protein [Kitasatospora sp. MAP5-34]
MDALRLIKTARHALAEARTASDALTEAWQAGLLTEAIGARIAERENGEVGVLGQLLCDAGAHAVSCLDQPPTGPVPDDAACLDWNREDWNRADWSGTGRAARLGEVGDLEPALEELGRLLHEAAETLVVLACGAAAESLYWRCIDGVDAGAECKDLVAELLRTVRKDADTPECPELTELTEPTELTDLTECADFADFPEFPEYSDRAAGCRGPGRVGPGPVTDQCAELGVPILLVPLSPPVAGRGYQPGAAEQPAELPAAPRPSAARVPEDCSSASSPARSALREASSSCICSSRVMGVAGVAGVAGSSGVTGIAGVAGVSDEGSDMRGPLQLGSAV